MRQLTKALARLNGTMFECPEPPKQTTNGIEVSAVWLLLVIEALSEFVHNDEWIR